MEESSKTFTITQDDHKTIVAFTKNLDAGTCTEIYQTLIQKSSGRPKPMLSLDFKNVDYMDTAGAVSIACIKAFEGDSRFKTITLEHLKPEHSQLIEKALKINQIENITSLDTPLSFIEKSGKRLFKNSLEAKAFISYVGQISYTLFQSLCFPFRLRWAQIFLIAERSGVNALPIVALISFIVGLVMAFQAAVPMRMFGAELYVADLIGVAMVRELGPLMTAIVLAGRSASAFAAEIGTMRINEEIDALTVMGLDPIRFLIIPRIIATTLVTPLLTIFSNLMGMLGGALVITSMGYPVISYYNQIVSFVKWNDFTGGLIKCLVFGLLISATGCIRGYQTKSGPSAVGVSTTRAVVTSIILIAVFDGIFSILYYFLGI